MLSATEDQHAAPRAGRRNAYLAVLACVLLVGSLAAAVHFILEALEERQVATAAVDLRLAALIVTADAGLSSHEGHLQSLDLAPAVELLQQDRDLALHALDRDERVAVGAYLDLVVEQGTQLLAGKTVGEEDLDDATIQRLLGEGANRADVDAARAEGMAAAALLMAIVMLGLNGWALLRLRYRSSEDRAVELTQIRAGHRLARLLNDSPDIFLVIAPDGRITYRSASAGRLLSGGITTREQLLELVEDADRARLDTHLCQTQTGGAAEVFELVEVDGSISSFELRVSDLTAEEHVAGHLVTASDVTNEVQLRRDLYRQARTDVLTGLPNRRALEPAIGEARKAMELAGDWMAMISLDLDGFKYVNDTLGHQAGDEMLIEVADRLAETIRPGDVLLRLGGDEFAVVLPTIAGATTATQVAQRLLDAMAEPFQLGHRAELVRASVGVSVAMDLDGASNLVSEADIAMYTAKRAGGNMVEIFKPEMQSSAGFASQVTRALRAADFDAEFHMVFQPIVRSDSLEVASYEGLLRWNSPSLGEMMPADFIPVAEASGEISAIGAWVLDAVCRQLAEWREQGLDPDVSISCNVSPRQLADEGFVAGVQATADRWSVPVDRLVVEVTESTVLDNTGVACHRIEALRELGVRISIDDFGSGYSNLGQLLRVPVDIIKIDRSLLLMLSEMRESQGGDPAGPCAIMQAIVAIASVLEAPVVCEGVETDAQLTSLRASGITHIQGYLTGRPAAAEAIALA